MRPDSEEAGRNRSLKHVEGSTMSFKKVSGLGWRGVADGGKSSHFGKTLVSVSSGRAWVAAGL